MMATYSDYEQRMLDSQFDAEMAHSNAAMIHQRYHVYIDSDWNGRVVDSKTGDRVFEGTSSECHAWVQQALEGDI